MQAKAQRNEEIKSAYARGEAMTDIAQIHQISK
jgi:hypothetical protein